ncbi:hypothetical protein [Sphingosinicella sp. LY1275]|uniref:hypothetical protein n=1 Tax=Sphingosinicella sp. LY1275 TaxID=3095379 RepID=UPI002ADEB443|nr:hypothetical protein [Sphingosinicella sp. LY1275]MEA1013798.1 hypothetical protein [Sphingosinicella sp. LY1275]
MTSECNRSETHRFGGTVSTVERAYQLAATPQCRTLTDLAILLKREGYSGVDEHLRGASLRRTLRALIASQGAAASPVPPDDTVATC